MDNELPDLIDDLKYIVQSGCSDVRKLLPAIREKMERRNNENNQDFSFVGKN
jgi:hypothetical protein